MCLSLTLAVALSVGNCGAHYQQVPVHVTFYTRAEGWNGGFTTMSGRPPQEGYAAANWLPFGTRIELWGRTYEVWDRGGGLEHRQVDVFFDGPDALGRGYAWLWEHRADQKVIHIVTGQTKEDAR